MESTLPEGADPGLRLGLNPGLQLIETLRGDSAPARLALHRTRMAAGAAALGWSFDAAGFAAALAGISHGRVRLTLGQSGDFRTEVTDLPPPRPEWRLGLSDQRLRSDDPWLRIKSTNRQHYDAARANLPPGLDEVLFLNERGEVCDGTITTVFFDRGQGMRTPPLSSGLLPGILRAELACPEEVLMAADLPHVRLWVGNALRGLIPTVWSGGPDFSPKNRF